MPLALRLKAMFGAPIVLDTHDIQAYQFELWRARSVYLRLRSSPEELLKSELAYTAMADAIVHINADEYEFFASRLPEKKHVLLYPPAKLPAPGSRHRSYFLIVGSNHQGNYLSVAWFLEYVYPLFPDIELKIVGRIDEIFRLLAPKTLERYRSLFIGRVDDLSPYYDGATAVLLPIVAGHGLSIKTVEAMSTGVPLVALPLAFRGMRIDVAKLDNVWLANDAPGFARCMREAERWANAQATGARRNGRDAGRPESSSPAATQRAYEELFSFDTYLSGISSIAEMAAQNGSATEGSVHPLPPNGKLGAQSGHGAARVFQEGRH
jgi:glycosyltransferase involved in cell wall biosynthesis